MPARATRTLVAPAVALCVMVGVVAVHREPAGYAQQTIFVLSLWTGWVISIGAAEWWIRSTRTAG